MRLSVKFAVLLRTFDIAPCPSGDVFLLIERQLPANFCGRAEHERAGRDLHSHGYQRVCADDGTRAHFDVVEDDGSHPDEYFIVDLARMNDRGVPDRDQFAYARWVTSVDVDDSVVLNVRARPDDDAIDITAQYCPVPD